MAILTHTDHKVVRSPTGTRLAVAVSGAPDGYPVFLLHGTPGSRNGPKPRGILLYRLGLKLICYDRPGYGDSERVDGRTVRDAAADVECIADALEETGRFAVVGRSGGGPHALAIAALLNERVSSVAALVSLAPYDAAGLDWYGGMNPHNTGEYRQADLNFDALLAKLTMWATATQKDPQWMLDQLAAHLCASDKRVVQDVTLRQLLRAAYREGVRQGPTGWIDDVTAFRNPWKFELTDITAPALLWHGTADRFSPLGHTLWLRDHMTGAANGVDLMTPSGVGHFGAVEALPSVLSWVAEQVASELRAP